MAISFGLKAIINVVTFGASAPILDGIDLGQRIKQKDWKSHIGQKDIDDQLYSMDHDPEILPPDIESPYDKANKKTPVITTKKNESGPMIIGIIILIILILAAYYLLVS